MRRCAGWGLFVVFGAVSGCGDDGSDQKSATDSIEEGGTAPTSDTSPEPDVASPDAGAGGEGLDSEAEFTSPEPTSTEDETLEAGPPAETGPTDESLGDSEGAGDAGTPSEADLPDAALVDEQGPTRDAGSDDEPASEPVTSSDGETSDPAPTPTDSDPWEQVPTDPAKKLDVLFVIDNSLSMADKQELMAEAVPDFVRGLVDQVGIDDLHVGIITSSLGGYGAAVDCSYRATVPFSEQSADMARLLASLPRGAAAAPSAAASGFLSWTTGGDAEFIDSFSHLVRAAGEFGCGWEATLESWYRFLIDPYPYTRVVRQQCPGRSDPEPGLCAGPELGPDGIMLLDTVLLGQRAQFLRPDSAVAIVMLSDENDCSFRASGQTWRLAQTVTGSGGFSPAFRATGACNDPAFGPNHECCHSCGSFPPSACPSETNSDGQTVAVGCAASRQYPADGVEDPPNLRCFQQKRRFGLDYLYPVERYSNALKLRNLCSFTANLEPEDDGTCFGGSPATPNPLFSDLTLDPSDPTAVPSPPRPRQWVFLTGILGVPWQDLAVSTDPADELVYKLNDPTTPEADRINWSWLIGERHPEDGIPKPEDPLMVESITPRTGANPATGEALAPPSAGYRANSINGHEWSNHDGDDLQYACIFPRTSVECLTREEYQMRREQGEPIPACDCTDYGGSNYQNPLCQQPNGSYGLEQTHGKAYPGLRQLQVLHDNGANSIVASICPKEPSDRNRPDYGYRPAARALLERLSEVLE